MDSQAQHEGPRAYCTLEYHISKTTVIVKEIRENTNDYYTVIWVNHVNKKEQSYKNILVLLYQRQTPITQKFFTSKQQRAFLCTTRQQASLVWNDSKHLRGKTPYTRLRFHRLNGYKAFRRTGLTIIRAPYRVGGLSHWNSCMADAERDQ